MDDLLPAPKSVKTDAPPGALAVGGQSAATIVMPSDPSDELLFRSVLPCRQNPFGKLEVCVHVEVANGPQIRALQELR